MTTPGPSLVVLCHGCRGSSPTSGTAFMEFGGATTCYEVLDQAGHRILVDCGTGLPGLGEDGQTFDYSVFLTHLHWDHTQGIPFWAPIYDPGSRLAFYAHRTEDLGTEEALDQVMR
ncbi:MAG: MBL fold metallo-hydrolase, partial [Acidimicrobiia bacterium]